ncbi:hypothetical protein BKH46_00295 [Helicobacter sp. 12S02634-8]|uniref:UbiA family prenyltransferase n=1 Tax=Helicobacter sp. 12S02634-8 TaxID=1476199 RepID=UPI000BC88A1B|nr:UbiA family prenyltransferase [Helicobacter sp. 12S02634-8]PAF48389.1 hypothetical protein BKH46_00295 [Helicobacter sp. 12S02634-8]
MQLIHIFHLMRIHQYVKNLFIFLPVFFSFKIFDLPILLDTLVAFVCFSLCASAVYIFNDVIDAPLDKIHPTKAKRPIAAGKISVRMALFVALILLCLGLVGAWVLIPPPPNYSLLIDLYRP